MAKKTYNELKVGLTVLVVILLSIYILIVFADLPGTLTQKQSITVKLPYKTGLKGLTSGSPIYLGGTKIGLITDTGIEQPTDTTSNSDDISVYFTMKIPAAYPLRDDCILVPESNVLGGQTLLAISDLGSNGIILNDGDTLESPTFANNITDAVKAEFDPDNPESFIAMLKYEVNRQNKDSIFASLADTADNFKHITEKIDEQIDTEGQKETLMAKLHSALDHLNEITATVRGQLDSEDNAAVLAKLNTVLDTLDNDLVMVKEMISTNKPEIDQMIVSLKNTATSLEKDTPQITAQLKEILTRTNRSLMALEDFSIQTRDMVQLNRDSVDTLIRNITEVSSNLKLASEEIRRAPWKLLYTPKKDELKIQGLIDTAGSFASGAERLDNATLRLKRVLADTKAGEEVDKDKIKTILTDLQTSFDQYKEVEQKLWKEIP